MIRNLKWMVLIGLVANSVFGQPGQSRAKRSRTQQASVFIPRTIGRQFNLFAVAAQNGDFTEMDQALQRVNILIAELFTKYHDKTEELQVALSFRSSRMVEIGLCTMHRLMSNEKQHASIIASFGELLVRISDKASSNFEIGYGYIEEVSPYLNGQKNYFEDVISWCKRMRPDLQLPQICSSTVIQNDENSSLVPQGAEVSEQSDPIEHKQRLQVELQAEADRDFRALVARLFPFSHP